MEELKEPEKKEAEKKRTSPGTGEQYLLAMIKCADWVPRTYKQLVDKHKTNTAVVKELYLCASDFVPVERVNEVLGKNPLEGALHLLRLEHLEYIAHGNYQDELSGIKKTTSSLEQEVRQMSETLTHIVTHVPNFEAMFPDLQPVSVNENNKPIEPSISESRNVQPEISENGQVLQQLDDTGVGQDTQQRENILESCIKKLRDIKVVNPLKKKRISVFIEKCLQEGYSQEQLNYFLDCIESGTTLEEIQRFSSPKLPVEMMQRLKTMEERKENRNGK